MVLDFKDRVATLVMDARFDFSGLRQLRQVLDQALSRTPAIVELHFELSAVSHIDSAALGMLLIAREKCNERAIKLVLRHPSSNVMEVFLVAKFETLFTIE